MQTAGETLISRARNQVSRWFYPALFAIAAAVILAFVVTGNGSPALVGRVETNRAGAGAW